jgi:hypothetical protein
MSKRKQAKELTRWSEEARQWATTAGRALGFDLYDMVICLFRNESGFTETLN